MTKLLRLAVIGCILLLLDVAVDCLFGGWIAMYEWIVTFGYGHKPYGHCYTKIKAPTRTKAERIMFDAACSHWCTTYSKEDGVEKRHNLQYVPFDQIKEQPPAQGDGICPDCGATAPTDDEE